MSDSWVTTEDFADCLMQAPGDWCISSRSKFWLNTNHSPLQPTDSPYEGHSGVGGSYSAGGVLFFFFRTLRRLSGIRYGRSALPSFLSRSSTGKRFNEWCLTDHIFLFLIKFFFWHSFKATRQKNICLIRKALHLKEISCKY